MHLSFHTPIFPLGIIDDGLSNDKKLIGSGQRTPHVFLNLCCKEIFFEKIPRLLHYILYTLFRSINENLHLSLRTTKFFVCNV